MLFTHTQLFLCQVDMCPLSLTFDSEVCFILFAFNHLPLFTIIYLNYAIMPFETQLVCVCVCVCVLQPFSKKAVEHVQTHLAKKQVPPNLFQVSSAVSNTRVFTAHSMQFSDMKKNRVCLCDKDICVGVD